MARSDNEVTVEFLQAFADAWNRHDVDAYEGKKEVREGFASVWESFPDAQWLGARHFMVGNRGVSEWTFTGANKGGQRVEVNGCDVFTFRDGKIRVKNSYRKHRSPTS
jgi:ketosteroid isomerase-like protein